ncbi:MAG: HypC/HybG/HupF family hydrogenase formation chaperone [Desulfobacterales bacterium]|nr:HypC/HybG/HupF family hydrogenase formation chaperone [Desulfobacterales bacterium]
MCLAIPGKILQVNDEEPFSRMAEVSFSGARKKISLALVPAAKVGDYALVHAGFAISILDEERAAEVFHYLKQLGDAAAGEEPE